jgi:MinD-like ATPase involved in chromosome partitioning or flagellar assembly
VRTERFLKIKWTAHYFGDYFKNIMAQIISVHSYRGGTGKSNTTANIATLLALAGRRVGVIDTDIQSPGIHVLFGLVEEEMQYSVNDYLYGRCGICEAAYDVTARLSSAISGVIYLIPSSIKAGEIARVLREGYDVGLLNDGFQALIDELALDVLMIDTHPGLNEETLLSIAISDALIIILRPDQQDYQGTSVTVEVARKLETPRLLLLVNKLPAVFDPDEVKARVEQTYHATVAAVLPHSDEMMALASSGIFVLRYPDHPVTGAYRQVASNFY